jgi:hypothetical protein
MRRRSLLVLAASPLMLVASCSHGNGDTGQMDSGGIDAPGADLGSGNDGEGAGNPIPFDQFGPRQAAALCAYAARCPDGSAFVSTLLHSTLVDCDAQLALVFAHDTPRSLAIARGTVVFDANAAGRCIAAIEGLPCGALRSGGVGPACEGIFTGTVADGARCTLSDECGATSYCLGAFNAPVCGRCTHQAQIGEPCSPTGFRNCPAASYCNASDACAAPIPLGGVCDSPSALCAPGLRCVMTSGSAQVTCGTPPVAAAGQSCTYPATCQPGLVCAPDATGSPICRPPRSDGTCQPPTYGELGDCAAGTVCDASTMRCAPYPSLGQSCILLCTGPARCIGGVCRSPGPVGMPCTTNADCIEGNCMTGTCAPFALCTP